MIRAARQGYATIILQSALLRDAAAIELANHDEEAPIVRLIFESYATGQNCTLSAPMGSRA